MEAAQVPLARMPLHISERSGTADVFAIRQEALDALVIPRVEVVRRKALGEPERYSDCTIYQESVRFSDGAVRKTTRVVPDNPATSVLTVSADPWVTGDEGFNMGEIKQLAQLDLPAEWVHHQGRHRIFPPTPDRVKTLFRIATSKGIARSAAQELALVQSLSGSAPFDTEKLLRRGYSRSGMSANAFIVQAEEEGAEVVFSHLEGECFPQAVSMFALAKAFFDQLPDEGLNISQVVAELIRKLKPDAALQEAEEVGESLIKYAKTLDLHPLNLVNELLWIHQFTTGEAGDYAQAVRLDANGLRIHYSTDRWAHIAKWLSINSVRSGLVTLEMPGAHTAGAKREMRTMKGRTFSNIARYALEHEGSLDGVTALGVLDDKYHGFIVNDG